MTRRTSLRIASALLTPWMVLTAVAPAVGRACPMMQAAHHTGAPGAMPSAPMDGMPGMAATAPAERNASAPATPMPSGAPCCCCTSGCCASAAVAITPAPEVAVAAIVARRDVQPVAPRAAESADAEHVLPFANGPPAHLA
jgi:hypothetical protein